MTVKIIPFEEDLLPQAAVLLSRQQGRYRRSYPLLPERFEDVGVAATALAALLSKKHCDGFAAVQDGRLVAYLLGDRVLDNMFFGRCGWVRSPGCAYDDKVGGEVVRDLYAALGGRWVEQGIFNHFVMMPLGDAALTQAWFSLSFGIEQVHGLIDLQMMQPVMPELPSGITIRRAGAGDGPIVAGFSDLIWKMQVQSPVWGVMLPEAAAETAEGWAELADDEDVMAWLAFVDGTATGVQAYWAADGSESKLFIPEGCVHLSVAGTRPEARGQGIGSLLTKVGLAQAWAAGYQFCEADWRSTNLLASRFWPRRGFRPVVYRLARRVDPRIAWAGEG